MSDNTSASGGYLTPTSLPPVEDDALDDIFTAMIVGISGLDGTLVRPRWQANPVAMPAPSVNWCAVGVVDDVPDDNAVVMHDGAANGGLGQSNLQRHEDVSVMATFYGPNAKGYAKTVRDGLSIPQNWETLQLESISFVAAGTIRAVPEIINKQWLRRYDLTLQFRRMIARSYAIQNIATAEIILNNEAATISIIVEP